jgi:hypothetical protein
MVDDAVGLEQEAAGWETVTREGAHGYTLGKDGENRYQKVCMI